MRADVIVVGGGPNGLTCAALLAKGGLKPLLLERRRRVGGGAVTEEFHPGFRASTVAHALGPFRASLLGELSLAEGRLTLLEPEPRLYAPQREGRGLALWGDPQKSAAEIARFSPVDAQRYPEFHRVLGRISSLLARLLALTPPDIDTPRLRELWPLLGLGLGLRRLGRKDARRLLRWGPMAVGDFVQEWFESELLRAVVAARGIQGMFAGPWSAGTTANLLLQAAAGGGNGAGSTVLVKGGLGALTEGLAETARRFGAEIREGAEVERITARDGRVAGVVLAGGEEITAPAVVSGLDPQRTFLKLLDPAHLDPDDLRRIRNYRQEGMASKVNLALGELPTFGLEAGEAPALLRGRLHIGPEVDALERAFDEAKHGGISRRPYLDITIPSLTDPDLAPPGRHVMSVYVQYTPYRLKEGDWKSRGREVLEAVLTTLEDYAPRFREQVIAHQVLSPRDLEETYGMTGGHPSHGEPSLDQLFLTRPLLGWARYRGPLAGLYLCGAGTHPGGGVTGGPGANAAREILQELR